MQPLGDAVAGDAGGHTQVQTLGHMGGGQQGGLFEHLRLHSPHHQGAVFQRSIGRRLHRYAMLRLQGLRCGGKGFNHAYCRTWCAMANQAAYHCIGHIATAYKGHGQQKRRNLRHAISLPLFA